MKNRKIISIKDIGEQDVVELSLTNQKYIDKSGAIHHNCKYCKDMYHDGSSFKIFKLSELLANGSPIGKKLEIGMPPVVPGLHPWCRHHIAELQPGWTLDSTGKKVLKKIKKD